MIDSVELLIKQPGHADRTVRLPEGATRLGRAEDNEVVLSDVGVSRRHAQVYVSRGEVTVEDLGSGNGTYYNGYRIQSQPVQDGDEIVIDPFVLQFRVRGVKAPERAASSPDKASPTPARLEVVVGTGMAGSSYPITSRGLSIGRSEDRDVVIPDPASSRHHCQITLQGGEYVLRDMGSANGVFVNAVRVRECTLADGDLIRIGNTEMRFVRYDEGAADNTTQVVQGTAEPYAQQWNEPAVGQPRVVVREEAPVRRRSSRPVVAMLVGAMLVFGAMVVLLVVVLVIVAILISMRPAGPPVFPAQAPRWSLKLPAGLAQAPVDKLFEEGRDKMRDSDRRGALQDFYRVLLADPGYRYVDKFAYAVGEYMVLDVLQREFEQRAAVKTERDAERDQLLRAQQTGPRTQRLAAENKLKRKFKEDPVVIEALGLPAPDSMIEIDKAAASATDQMANGRYDEAALTFQRILDQSEVPAVRRQALANLKLSMREVARGSADTWSRAVMLEAEGKVAEARATFQAVQKAHPANTSAPVHLKRLE